MQKILSYYKYMKYIFEINNDFKNIKITFDEPKEIEYDKTLFCEYNDLASKIDDTNKYKKIFSSYMLFYVFTDKRLKLNKNNEKINHNYEYYNILLKKIGHYYNEKIFYVEDINDLNKFKITSINNDINNNINNICNLTFSYNKIYKNTSRHVLEKNINRLLLILLYNLNDYLKKGGGLMIRIYSFTDYKTFLIFMLFLSYFKKAYIVFGNNIFLKGFKKNIDKNTIKKIFQNDINFNLNVDLNNKYKNLMSYTKHIVKIKTERSIYILNDDIINLKKLILNYGLSTFLELGLYNKIDNKEYNVLIYNILNNDNNIYPYNYSIINKYVKKFKNKIDILEINSSEGIFPIYVLKNFNNAIVTSLYENNVKNKYIDNMLDKYCKNKKLILNNGNIKKNIDKLIKKRKKYDILVVYFTSNINVNAEILKHINVLSKKKSYIFIDYSFIGSIEFEKNLLKKYFSNIKKIKENLSLLVLKK